MKTWTDPEQINVDTAERRTLVKKVGVVGGQVVECWVVNNGPEQTRIETLEEDE